MITCIGLCIVLQLEKNMSASSLAFGVSHTYTSGNQVCHLLCKLRHVIFNAVIGLLGQKELKDRYNILYSVLRILCNTLRNPGHITNLLLFQLHIGIKHAILKLLKERLFV